MLDTLNRYVQGSGGSTPGLQDWRPGAGLDRRWPAIITLSIFGHLLFFAAIVAFDWWIYHLIVIRRPVQPELKLQAVLVAPPGGDRAALRAAPEHLELLDPRRIKFEAGSDDTRLLPRSPSPGASAESGTGQAASGSGPGADSKPSAKPPDSRVASNRSLTQPPSSRSVQAPDAVAAERPAPATLPVSPAVQPPAPPVANDTPTRNAAGSGQSAEDPGRSSKMGLRLAQSQYVAYVRQRIFRTNERIAPKGYQDILPGEVVAEFSLILDRNGRIRTVRLTQSCGYATLDKIARQAISLAEPFDGFPAELPDPFEMTVWVHYH